MNSSRVKLFAEDLKQIRTQRIVDGSRENIAIIEPIAAKESDLLVFHTKKYVEHVRELSNSGQGDLNYEDTPAFKGVFEASLYPVGNTLNGLRLLMEGKFEHFFNPIGGLHHALADEARGFCVFNDSGIAISKALEEFKLRSVAYVDIDAHHGDGIYYEFEADPRVIVADVHEDGRYLYPGTGDEGESGSSFGLGTKLNIPLPPGSTDKDFFRAFDSVEEFLHKAKPDLIFFQCGADGLAGDPLSDMKYTSAAHAYATKKLHTLAHEMCQGRILAMGGGGYNAVNVSAAWSAVIEELSGTKK